MSGLKPAGEGKWRAYCPAHQDHDPSLSVKIGSDGTILLKCYAGCPVEAIAKSLGITVGDLFREGRTVGHNYQRRDDGPSPFDRHFWSKVYAVLGSELPLLPEDEAHLIERGLEGDDLKLFRSLHPEHNDRALRAVQAAFKGRIWDVPGIVRRPDKSAGLVVNRGILIPLIDPASRIMAFQVRTGIKGSKYVWLTRKGVVGKEVHFARRPVTTTWVVTEGPLKAQVAQAFLGRDLDETVVGLGGVGNWQSLVPLLQEHRPTHLSVALDMDKAGKPGVLAAQEGLIKAAKKAGVPQVAVTEWDAKYKGFDDALAASDSNINERIVP